MIPTAFIRTQDWATRIDLLNPRVEDIRFGDIAIGLARNCRYVRQCPIYYSVAEHSWLLAASCLSYYPELLEEDPASFRRLQLRCLLHDGSEAYLVDMPGPLKDHPALRGYCDIEDHLQGFIYESFGLPVKCTEGHDRRVKLLDRAMVAEEMAVLWKQEHDVVRKEFDVVKHALLFGERARLIDGYRLRHAFGVRGYGQVEALEMFGLAHSVLIAGGVFRGFPHEGRVFGR